MLNRIYFALFTLVAFPTNTWAQVPTFQDCLGAIPICLNSYSTGSTYTGTGNIPNEINPVNSCLLTGERNDVWYIITTSSAGNLNISIIPNNAAHNYDWAIYNLTGSMCSDIFSNPSLEVACNYSNLPGTTGPNGLGGAQNGPVIPVTSGQTYLINVSGFSSFNQSGYTIDLSNSTTSIVDNTSPVLSGITAVNCGASSIMASFSERVLCSSVQASDFTLTGPGGPYTINAVTSTSCTAGATYARDYNITFSPAISISGAYTLSLVNPVTDLCSNTSSVPQAFFFNISGINITFQKVDVTCFGGNNGSATANITGPPGPYTYQWSPSGGSGPSAQWLTAGTYTVTVTSPLGCSAQASVTISQPLTGLTASASVNPANGCAANGSATINVTSGQPPFTYNWWPAGGNAATATNLTAGSYMVTITDANQCVLNYFFTVPSIAGPTVAISNFSNVSCFGGSDGSASVSVTGAPGPFQYQWLPIGGNAATATGLPIGNYNVSVIIAPGCTLSAAVSITEPPTALNVGVNSIPTSCGNNNGSISLIASGGAGSYTYQWTPNITTASSASGLPGGTYTITVSDGNGCTEVSTLNIQSSTQPVPSFTATQDVSCFGLSDGSIGVVTNGGTAPISLQWSNGQTNANLNNIPAGTYTATVTDALGCSASISSTINQPTELVITQQQLVHVNCFGETTGSASVIATGGSGNNTWAWSGNASVAPSISNVGAGTYTVTVTDQNGCNASIQLTINQPATPLILQGSTVETTCGNNDGSVTTTVTGGIGNYNYQWNTGATASSLNSLYSGIYTLTVTDQNGCSASETYTIQSSDAPVISIASIAHVRCAGENDGSVVLLVTGGDTPYAYSWQGNISTSNSATGLTAGSYNVTVTDASGCQSFQQVNILEPDPIAIQTSASSTICIGSSTLISAIPSGGVLPYTYLWSNGSTTAQMLVSPSASTSYFISVTDDNGCLMGAPPVTVSVLPPLNFMLTSPDSVCVGEVANISIVTNGGDGNYGYAWSNGLTGASNSLIISSDTTLSIIISDGCSTPPIQTSVSISAVQAPGVNFNISSQGGCEPFDAVFAIPHGLPAYQYLWNFGDGYTSSQDSVHHIYMQDGLYDVSLTIAYPVVGGCATILDFQDAVNVKPQPEARFVYDPPSPTRNHPDVYFSDRSTGAILWVWNFGDNSTETRDQNPHHVYSDTGMYKVSLRIQSNDGCMDSTSQEVQVKDDFEVFIPNAFTPDGSGTNDFFKIYGVGISSYELSIYDRWGKKVHYAKNMEEAWDGTDDASGQIVPQGLYVYKITIVDNTGNVHDRFNHVTVIR